MLWIVYGTDTMGVLKLRIVEAPTRDDAIRIANSKSTSINFYDAWLQGEAWT